MAQWLGRKPALAPEHWRELLEVRRRLRSIPSVQELARRWGVSEQTVRNYLRNRVPKQMQGLHDHEPGH